MLTIVQSGRLNVILRRVPLRALYNGERQPNSEAGGGPSQPNGRALPLTAERRARRPITGVSTRGFAW